MKPHICILLIGLLLPASCSVREDRTACPCQLEIDISEFAACGHFASVAFWEGPNACREEARTDSRFIRSVQKDVFDASVWWGARADRLSGSRLIVPQGAQPDSLQAFRTRLDCLGETCTAVAVPHRQHARVTLKVQTEPDTRYPYVFYAESDYCGIDLRDLSPVRGGLVYPLRQTAEDTFVFDLLRQGADTKVVIGIYDEKQRADELPLWDWMRAADYDWEATDLEDMTIYLDYVRQKVRIVISSWHEGEVVEADI